ncbi:hypothetical protein [Coleofasciculus sp. FACHB-1120]|nr:hypothetical protein [Coleofasciculus sp. FACHB-1120]
MGRSSTAIALQLRTQDEGLKTETRQVGALVPRRQGEPGTPRA